MPPSPSSSLRKQRMCDELSAQNSPSSSSIFCPICLSPFSRNSYLDSCLHEFCYDCIVRWTKVVASKQDTLPSSVKCPLCKRENLSVLTEFDGKTFQRHYINKSVEDSFVLTKAHKCRLQCYYTEPGILNNLFNVSRYWKSRKYLNLNAWLSTWLKREIQALVQEKDVDIIVHHIRGVIDSCFGRLDKTYPMKKPETIQEEFKAAVHDAATPFLHARTDRFVDELELFLASGMNIEAYDAVYMSNLGQKETRETTEATSVDSVDRPLNPYLYVLDAASDDETE